MRRTVLDSATKEALRRAVRGLRERLLVALDEAAEREYRLQTSLERAQLPVDRRVKRERLEAWLEEQVRAESAAKRKGKGAEKVLRDRFLRGAVKEAAYTLLNRLVFVRILEHHGLIQPALVSKGWDSPAYRDEFVHYSHGLQGDDTRGYAALLELLYVELALDLPGLFGPVGLTQLFPVPAASLREVIEALNDKALDRAWGDDLTLGWVYQFWNDPEREALDRKISDGGKIEPHEIAPKTQMFTERYMVEWLLHNSLGQTWLALCAKHGWTPDFHQVRDALEARRAEWRRRREAGEVALDALMPLESELEERWKYWVPQPLPEDAIASAPSSIRELKLLDPACGSGHFLVVAFDLLAALYEEEARHRGESWQAEEIARSIIENNLHGVDIDPRAVQLAAAGLWLKARLYAPEAELRAMNLVAPVFRLAGLPKSDPAFERLCTALDAVPVPRQRKQELMERLAGVDHLGTLLPVDGEIEQLLEQARGALRGEAKANPQEAKEVLRRWFAEFLDAHAARAELGLRLDGEQVAAGLRFFEIVRDGAYDVVVGNPPYQGTSKLADGGEFVQRYPAARSDLFACFYLRALKLIKPGGACGFITLSNWMFLSTYEAFRKVIFGHAVPLLADLGKSAFTTGGTLISTACAIVRRPIVGPESRGLALRPNAPEEVIRDEGQPRRTEAALLIQRGRHEFDVSKLSGIEGMPLVYWWDERLLQKYLEAPKFGQIAPARKGLCTGNDGRFIRYWWEPMHRNYAAFLRAECTAADGRWLPTVRGGKGRKWFEGLIDVVNYGSLGLELRMFDEVSSGVAIRNPHWYLVPGIAFSMIGTDFSARIHRYRSVFGNKGSSVFPSNLDQGVCALNAATTVEVLRSLNPGIGFEVGDVNRAPCLSVPLAGEIVATLGHAFAKHESHNETSVEFRGVGPSPWRHVQAWAQRAVDRMKSEPLPPYEPEYDPPDPTAYISFAIGVALGRFGANGEGILTEAPATALPAGILYLTSSETLPDSLAHPAAARIAAAWAEHGPAILEGERRDLRDWLRNKFFAYHKTLYENRPIYFPLSSAKKNFVAFVSIHRWADTTLQALLADHLHPNLRQLDASIADLNQTRASSDRKAASGAERQYTDLKRLRDELAEFIAVVSECAERGAPPTGGCPAREVDAPFRMDLDDGVMINSAALWPLLEPQWKDPKKWWKELCEAKGRKDYDWAHLSARYFPKRVDEKCRIDPSLAVARGCFWRYHPAKAYAWELRLAHEIGPDFAINEKGAAEHRARFLAEHAEAAKEILQKERDRREKLRRREAENADDHPGLVKTSGSEPPESDIVDQEDHDDEQVA
ncbi:MAG TPA: BREX-6 system adenine-specific DNA-methyltransferase PglX [Polyangiaceae bacterium]|nr:BREX-6 system adenine-specific DNA-methyltransferase PglX [Polyangiaceae bacterium]